MKDKYIKCDFCEAYFNNECQEKNMHYWHREPYCKRAIKRMIKALGREKKNER
jgi:hypothetical protein